MKESDGLKKVRREVTKEKFFEVLKDGITFSGQVGAYVVSERVFEWVYSEIEARDQEITMLRVVDEKQRQDNENLKSTMVAAAEEIMRCWPDHCDDEGYGPASLMHRLEKGIAANYPGYKFGAFTNMEAKISHLQATLEAADEVIKIFERPYEYNELQVRTILHKYNQLKTKSQS